MVELEGRIDYGQAAVVREKLLGVIRPGSRITLSLKRVSYLDTAGVAVFVEASRRAKDLGVCLTLADISEAANAALEIVHLDHFFPADSEAK